MFKLISHHKVNKYLAADSPDLSQILDDACVLLSMGIYC